MRSSPSHRLVFAFAVLAATLAASVAQAQSLPPGRVSQNDRLEEHSSSSVEPSPGPTSSAENRPALSPRERRALPDYDGRGRPGTSVGDALLWVPRVALFPLYVVTEYGIRAPLGFLVSQSEKAHVPQYLMHVFRPRGDIVLFPTAVIDLGLVASVGGYFAWQNALIPHNILRVRAATGGPHYWLLNFADEYNFANNSVLGMQVSYLERGDWRFYGIGPNTYTVNDPRFGWGRGDVGVYFRHYALHHFGADLATGLRFDYFVQPYLNPTLQAEVPGYQNKQFLYMSGRVFLDTRPANNPDTTGARLELAGMLGFDYRNPGRRWASYDAEGSVFLELKHPGRVLSLRTYVGFADSLGSEPVSFVDLITLGGFESMRGWYVGRFRGESAAVATLNYRYPVWYWLDGNVYVEAGNAFGHHLEGFDVTHLFGSAGIGFRTVGNRDMSFDMLLAVGTSRFDEPFKVDSIRLALGLNRGF